MTASDRDRPAMHGDRGLQPERTSLAWIRTLLSLAAVAVLCLRLLPSIGGGAWGAVVLVGVLVFSVVALLRVPAHRLRSCALFAEEVAAPAVHRARALVLAVVAVAAVALVAVLV